MYNRKTMSESKSEDWLKDLPLTAESIGFKPEQMIVCAKCARSNPPNRLKCFYCGGELETAASPDQPVKLNLRKLENWESGFNVIFQAVSESFDEAKMFETAGLLKLEKETLRQLVRANKSLPLARAESKKEAEMTRTNLRSLGVETFLLSDETLAVKNPPARLRGIEFAGDKLRFKLFNRDEIVEISSEDLALIVTGAVFERRIAGVEEYNKKGDGKILDTSETASDEILIDLYSRRDASGYRIYTKGFDFSTLGAEKQLLAKDNIVKLAAKLRQIALDAKFVDDYLSSRNVLAAVWEVEQRTDSQNLKRGGIGKFNVENLTTVNNLSQFTKYSRLQWHLL